MRKLKRYLAMFMAAVIAVTSLNIPAVAVYAQDTGDAAQVAEELWISVKVLQGWI